MALPTLNSFIVASLVLRCLTLTLPCLTANHAIAAMSQSNASCDLSHVSLPLRRCFLASYRGTLEIASAS